MKANGEADLHEIDRYDDGVGWIAYPNETMERASHAVAVSNDETGESDVWVFDPVDAPGVDDLLSELGTVAGVVVGLDRHERDAAAIANRHDVPVYVPDWMTGVATKLDAPVERFGRELGGLQAITIRDSSIPPWQEVGLYDEGGGTLYVPESVGTSSYMRTGIETLGVHPMLRLFPPRRALSGLDPERVLCGHGAGVMEEAGRELAAALDSSRGNAPGLYAKAIGQFLG